MAVDLLGFSFKSFLLVKSIKSNQKYFPHVRFTVKNCIVDAFQDHGRYHKPTPVDRDKGSREWFKNSANHLPGNKSVRDIMTKEEKNGFKLRKKMGFKL